MPADQTGEILEVVDEDNRVIGLEQRAVVHYKGLRHRAVYCIVLDSKKKLLLQQRSPQYVDIKPALPLLFCLLMGVLLHSKQIGPGQWDLSIAEHLAPGETYKQVSHQRANKTPHKDFGTPSAKQLLVCRQQSEGSLKSWASAVTLMLCKVHSPQTMPGH